MLLLKIKTSVSQVSEMILDKGVDLCGVTVGHLADQPAHPGLLFPGQPKLYCTPCLPAKSRPHPSAEPPLPSN